MTFCKGKDDNVILSPIKPMTLEEAISFIREAQLVEVTPLSKSCALRPEAAYSAGPAVERRMNSLDWKG